MDRTERRTRAAFWMMLLVTCIVRLVYLREERIQSSLENGRRFSPYSESQIYQRTQELYRVLNPDSDALEFNLACHHVKDRNFWLVASTDQSSKDAFTAIWDAATGELCAISRHHGKTSAPPYILMAPDQAIHEALRWRQRLQHVAHLDITDKVHSITFRDNLWVITWHSRDVGCNITLDRSGNLLLLSQWKATRIALPPPATP